LAFKNHVIKININYHIILVLIIVSKEPCYLNRDFTTLYFQTYLHFLSFSFNIRHVFYLICTRYAILEDNLIFGIMLEILGAFWHRPRGPSPVEPGPLEGDARCPPTSSWWALETPVTLARSGSGRRPSGGHGGGGGAIGGEIALQPPPPVFLNTPGLTGEFRTGSELEAGGWTDQGQRGGVASLATGRRLQIAQGKTRVMRPPWCPRHRPGPTGRIWQWSGGAGGVVQEQQLHWHSESKRCLRRDRRGDRGAAATAGVLRHQPRSHGSEFRIGGLYKSRLGAGECCRARERPASRGRGRGCNTASWRRRSPEPRGVRGQATDQLYAGGTPTDRRIQALQL
jgi:hypothetical protein